MIVSGETRISESCVRRLRPIRIGMLQIAALTGTVVLLSGCSYLQELRGEPAPPAAQPVIHQPPPAVPQKDVTATPKPRRPVRETVRETKEPERVASVDPKTLIGLAPAAVERLLGSPSNVSKVDPSLVWTYSGQGCSFQVFFYPDLKTASFHALKYSSTAGEQADNACIRNILTVRSNGPS